MNIKSEANSSIVEEAVAVIGMAGRFPGAKNVDEFWQILRDSRDVIHHFSAAELRQAGIAEALINNPHYVKARGILHDVEYFDADFFGMNPYEATITDPQHRLFLELCWEGLEVAGYTSDKYQGLIGVFASMSDSTYLENNLLKNDAFLASSHTYQTQIATSVHFLATKVAYYLNLKGPCLNINTACSSSLVAIIKACQSLQVNECDVAVAGGVSIRVPQIKGYLYREGDIFSADGRCCAFDKDASGTVSSNAAGVVILKRLADAIKDGDNIEAIIKSYAINNDGAAKAGYTAPSILEQSRCIATALSTIDAAESISYIETHGTGTTLGDPIEIAALTKAFRHYTQKKHYCAIGSAKTNIGHTDTAAGVVGFIKTVLALKHKLIPASLHFKQPNPVMQLADSPFFVNQVLREWLTDYPVRRAGVSSFGIGGTNAHIILEEATHKKRSGDSRPIQIISLSAKTPTALCKLQEKFLEYFEQREFNDNDLADIAYTLQVGRKDFIYRKSYIANNKHEIIALIKNNLQTVVANQISLNNKRPKIVFLFSDQSTLFSGMAKTVYENEPVFRGYIEQAAAHLEPKLKEKVLRHILETQAFVNPNNVPASIQQPALFILEYGLTKTLMEWDVKPDALLGYGIGGYVAAHFAGILSLPDAIQLVTLHGKLTDTSLPNSMLLYKEILNTISLQSSKIPCISNVTGDWLTNEDLADVSYFEAQFSKTTLFSKALSLLINEDYNIFIEIGVGHTLTTLINQQFPKESLTLINTLPDEKKFLSNPASQIQAIQHTLSQCWTNHIAINWNAYYLNETRQKVPLPTYPFEKSYYWLEPSQQLLNSLGQQNIPYIYQPYWEVADHPIDMDFSHRKNWLIFADDFNIAHQLSQYLANYSQSIILVNRGSTFKQVNSCHYQINPASIADYKMLADALRVTYCLPDYVLHCWSLSRNENSAPLYLANDIQVNGFLSLVYFAQAFLESIYAQPLQITIITNNLKSILSDDPIMPDKATLLGACLVIPQEYPQIICRIIDTDIIDLSDADQNKYLPHLLNEVNTYSKDNIIAYRKGIRFIKHFKEYQPGKINIKNNYIKKTGIYLITGGLGKIGIKLAEFLAEHYSANLILLGHTNVPSEEEWQEDSLIDKQDKQRKEMVTRLKKIKTLASSLLIVQCDVSDYLKMEKLFDEIKAKYLRLDGIFHLAGIADKTARIHIKDLTTEQVNRLFLPKIQGTKIIQRLIDKLPVDFCLLYSSLASVLGGVSLAGYSASNCYLNSIVDYYKNTAKTRWISINWDAWNLTDATIQQLTGPQYPYKKLEIADGMNLLKKCSRDFEYNRNFIISTTRLNERLEKWINPISEILPTNLKNKNVGIQSNENDYVSLKDKLKIVFQDCLGITNINENDNFYDIGGDSLAALRLLEMLEKTFLIRLKLSDLIKNNTVVKLAALIQNQQYANSFSNVLKIKESGAGLPLFLIHPVGGHIFSYLELIKYLPKDNPCYAIQDPSIEATELSFKSIEEMASYYLNQIQIIQPAGPYFIGGFSLGANIAFEMGRQLIDRKMQVGALFLIDGWAAFSSHFKNYDRFYQAMQRTIQELDNYLPGVVSNKKRLLDLAWHRMQLLFNYAPGKIDEKLVILFKAKEILPEYTDIDEITNHWQHYLTNPIEVHYIPGNHTTILKAEGAKEIGKIISQYVISSIKQAYLIGEYL